MSEAGWDMDSLEQSRRAGRIVKHGEAVLLITKPTHELKEEFEHQRAGKRGLEKGQEAHRCNDGTKSRASEEKADTSCT